MFDFFLVCIALICTPISTSYNTNPTVPPVITQKVEHKPYNKLLNEREIKCLTDNIYFEARSENDIGKKAVALVTLNRLKGDEYQQCIQSQTEWIPQWARSVRHANITLERCSLARRHVSFSGAHPRG